MNYESLLNDTIKHSERNDCVVVALALLFDIPYPEAHDLCKAAGRKNRCAMYSDDWWPLFIEQAKQRELTFIDTAETLGIKTVKSFQKEMKGVSNSTYLIRVRRHVCVFRDGEVQDWSKNRRNRIKNAFILADQDLLSLLQASSLLHLHPFPPHPDMLFLSKEAKPPVLEC